MDYLNSFIGKSSTMNEVDKKSAQDSIIKKTIKKQKEKYLKIADNLTKSFGVDIEQYPELIH